MARRRAGAGLLGALLMLLAASARAVEREFPRDLVQAVFASAFEVVLERHLEAAAPAELGLWSLRGLEVLDPGLRPELSAGTLLLSDPERLLGARPVPGGPPPAAAGQLATALAALFEAAWRASPALRRAGAEGMLRSAFEELFNHLDPYSRYLSAAEARAARARRVGQSGLGLRLGAGRGGAVVVARVEEGGPAEEAGLRAGDRLLAVDGVAVSAHDLGAAVALLEGPPGSQVRLTLQRAGRRLEVVLPRLAAQPPALRAERRQEILWLTLEVFANDTDRRLAEALAEARRAGALRGLVLDLRGNRGGLLGQAVAVASAFLPGGVVIRTSGRHPEAERLYLADEADIAAGLPMVLLVDGRSASAAEIVAASLSDRGRAVVAGSTTMGKGLIQVVAPLPNGGELLVTWARVLAPGGWPIQGLGVVPALCTSLGAEALAETLARLRRGESPMAPLLARLRAARPPVPASEQVALREACPPAEGREADLAAAQALLDSPPAYEAARAR
ncbi:S41 family peptidase [Crenalkalicoccus roseus]|uniref:S41 family peptidase n=1 Tax=Crenalkalicoccus roseus TaxID=1485588 RepID=UPI001080AE7B|nr:S41 family peptidase [Crenalkalicoccus roseus]